VTHVYRALSAIGRRLLNWNDRHYRPGPSGDYRRVEQSWLRKTIDRLATRLYVLGDRADRTGATS